MNASCSATRYAGLPSITPYVDRGKYFLWFQVAVLLRSRLTQFSAFSSSSLSFLIAVLNKHMTTNRCADDRRTELPREAAKEVLDGFVIIGDENHNRTSEWSELRDTERSTTMEASSSDDLLFNEGTVVVHVSPHEFFGKTPRTPDSGISTYRSAASRTRNSGGSSRRPTQLLQPSTSAERPIVRPAIVARFAATGDIQRSSRSTACISEWRRHHTAWLLATLAPLERKVWTMSMSTVQKTNLVFNLAQSQQQSSVSL